MLRKQGTGGNGLGLRMMGLISGPIALSAANEMCYIGTVQCGSHMALGPFKSGWCD